jgi:hypothetical protein
VHVLYQSTGIRLGFSTGALTENKGVSALTCLAAWPNGQRVQTFAILPRPFGQFEIFQLFTAGNGSPRLESPAKHGFASPRLGAGPNNSD